MTRTKTSKGTGASVNTGFREALLWGLLSSSGCAQRSVHSPVFDFAAARVRITVGRPVPATLRVDNVRNDILLRSHNRFLLQLC